MLTKEDKSEIDAYITHRIIMFYERMKKDGELLQRSTPSYPTARTKPYKRPEWDWQYENGEPAAADTTTGA